MSCYTLYLLLMAKYWRFPVPFAVLVETADLPIRVVNFGCGSEKVRENPLFKQQADVSRPFTMIQTGFILIYPAYIALFLRLRQIAFILVLLAIKYGMSRLLARQSKRVPITKTF